MLSATPGRGNYKSKAPLCRMSLSRSVFPVDIGKSSLFASGSTAQPCVAVKDLPDPRRTVPRGTEEGSRTQ